METETEDDPIEILERTKEKLLKLREDWFKPIDTSEESILGLLTPEQKETVKKLKAIANQNGK